MHYAESNCAELNCAEFKVRLDAALDARRPPQRDADLSRHARKCPKCAQWLASHATLLGAVQSFPAIVARADFSARVVQQFEADVRTAVRWRRLAIASLAVAAGLLIALLPLTGCAGGTRAAALGVDLALEPLVGAGPEKSFG